MNIKVVTPATANKVQLADLMQTGTVVEGSKKALPCGLTKLPQGMSMGTHGSPEN